MRQRVLPLLPALIFSIAVQAQSIRLSLPDTTVQSGDTLVLPISAVAGFEQVVSAQFSIRWNPAVIRYLDQLPGNLNQVAIGPTAAEQGILRFSWFDAEGQGVTLPGGAPLVRLRFKAEGPSGDSTAVLLADAPLRIQIFRAGATPGIFDSLALVQDTGLVRIAGQWQPGIQVQGTACFAQSTGSIILNTTGAPPGAVYRWSGPGGFVASTPSVSGLRGGIYTLRIETPQGALIYETQITVPEPPELLLTPALTTPGGCAPGGGSATVAASGGTPPYLFHIPGLAGQNTGTFTGLAAGSYALTLTDAAGCTVEGNFVIDAAQPPRPDLGDDVTLCPGESTVLDAGNFASYRWSDGSGRSALNVDQPGAYSVTVTDALGCTGADTVVVILSTTVNIVLQNDNLFLCPGDSLQFRISGGADYRWIDTSGTLSRLDVPNPIAKPRTTTAYTVIASTACAADTATFLVQVYNVRAQAGPDTCIQRGQTIRLFATGGLTYSWDRSDYSLSSFTSPNPTVTPLRSTVFRVTVRDFNGCETVIEVPVAVVDGAPDITLINLISPNGDGKNDVLEFPELDKFANNALKVYNRWGDLVYQKLGYQTDAERFDGTFQGKPLPAGNYFYVLSFAQTDFKQTLTIVRD